MFKTVTSGGVVMLESPSDPCKGPRTLVVRAGAALVLPRALHVMDVENLVGTGRPSEFEVAACAEVYRTTIAPAPRDHIVTAASSEPAAIAIGFGWPGARLRWQSGQDGADKCLLEVLIDENVPERFGRVVVGSGDGIFADPAAWLAGRGVHVTVVAREGHLSRRLQLAAHEIVLLPEPTLPTIQQVA